MVGVADERRRPSRNPAVIQQLATDLGIACPMGRSVERVKESAGAEMLDRRAQKPSLHRRQDELPYTPRTESPQRIDHAVVRRAVRQARHGREDLSQVCLSLSSFLAFLAARFSLIDF